jgi:hypothetical protein
MGCGGSKPQALGPQEISKNSASHKGEVQRQSGSVKGAASKQNEHKAVQPKYEEVRSTCCTPRNPFVFVQTYQFSPSACRPQLVETGEAYTGLTWDVMTENLC